MKTNPKQPAFPRAATDTYADRGADGMDIRTFMATAFVCAMVANPSDKSRVDLAKLAVVLADDLIKELNKGEPNEEVPSED